MLTLVLLAGVVGCSVAAPQYLGRSVIHPPKPAVTYEYHDVHQSPVPSIKQTHAAPDRVPVKYEAAQPAVPQAVPQAVQPVVPQIAKLQNQYFGARSLSPANPSVAILSMNQEATYDGNFNYGFESADGIQASASGSVRSVEGSELPGQVMRGSYSYTAPDGRQVVTSWYADETGFHAEGDHIPPVPEAIRRSVEYLRSLPPYKEPEQYAGHN